jgi:antitoxin component of RelBE/YafQ-DinJ toxin-antitoxin module
MMLMRVAAEKALPFDVKAPNAVTARTLRRADRGEDLVDPKMPYSATSGFNADAGTYRAVPP